MHLSERGYPCAVSHRKDPFRTNQPPHPLPWLRYGAAVVLSAQHSFLLLLKIAPGFPSGVPALSHFEVESCHPYTQPQTQTPQHRPSLVNQHSLSFWSQRLVRDGHVTQGQQISFNSGTFVGTPGKKQLSFHWICNEQGVSLELLATAPLPRGECLPGTETHKERSRGHRPGHYLNLGHQ